MTARRPAATRAAGGAPARAEGALALTARAWSATAALGFGLVACGTGAGHLGHHLPVGVALTGIGLAALAWSVAALRGPAATPRAALGGLLAAGPLVLLSAPATGSGPTVAEGAALVLALAGAVLLGLAERAAGAPGRTGRRPGPFGQLAVLATGSVLVALVTVPGLAATEAGEHAVPHGQHGQQDPDHGPGLPAEQPHH